MSYDVSYDPTVKALGFDAITPTPIPWAVAKLYAPGATLSIKNAQVMQGTLTPHTQVPNPPTSKGQRPPDPQQAAEPVAEAEADPAELSAADAEPGA